MCDPVSIGLAISVASTAFSYIQQSDQADKEQEAINRNAAAQNEQTKLRYEQINAQSKDEMSQRAREALVERGRLRAASGESGLMGGVLDRLENESYFNQGSDIASIESNRKAGIVQAHTEARGGAARSQSQMNSIKRPSLIGAGLQIAGAGVQYQTTKEKQKLADRSVTR